MAHIFSLSFRNALFTVFGEKIDSKKDNLIQARNLAVQIQLNQC